MIALTLVALVSINATEPNPNPHEWDIAVLDRLLNSAPPEVSRLRAGDMILSRRFVQAARDSLIGKVVEPEAAFDGGVVLWPGGVIPYVFDGNVSAKHQKAFLDGAAEWSTVANLTFVVRTTESDYVLVQEGTGENSSAVGKLGGEQLLTVSAWVRDIICHELGHTIGLVHEHQRSDRDDFVNILTQNIQPGLEFAFALLPNSNNRGGYDFLSVMHYVRHAFSTAPSLDTIEPKTGYTQYLDVMGNTFGHELSQLDRQGVASIYGAGPTLSSVVTNTNDSGPGSLRAAIFYGIDHPNTTITFNIPADDPGYANNTYLIQPSDVMTTPGPGTVIDGGTQPNRNPNGPSIVLDGSLGPQPDYPAPAFYLNGADVTLRSLCIRNSPTDGIQITGAGATGNTIVGCYIGLNADGTTLAPNTYEGVVLSNGAHDNTIGGTDAGERNFICGNGFDGVALTNAGTTGNVVQGNTIGLNTAGAPVPNSFRGVTSSAEASGNMIGGTTDGAPNIISGNTYEGIAVFGDSKHETFRRNEIFNNGDIGIRLWTFDPGTPNDLQAMPSLTSSVLGINNTTLNGATAINGSLISIPNTSFRIEFFASPTADPSGFGEGQFFLGETNVNTNGTGSVNFSFEVQAAVPVGYAVAATATNPAGSTSEFSQVANVTTTDFNSDGIPDAWATAHGFTKNASIANQDTDGTGMTNLQKFFAGLDPRDTQSFLRLTSVVKQGNGIQLSFPSVTGRIYQLESRADLINGSWQPLIDGIAGTGASVQVVDAQGAGIGRRFYRLRVVPP
ncbi:MAG: M12 family metallopeptidase [Chthoniobacterales bacterium]